MKIGVTYPSSTDFPAVLEEVAAYDDAGVDAIWLGESYGYDAVSVLGALTQVTSHARLGPGIVPIYSRTPTLLAQTAATLDALSEGRAMLGLGASGPAVIEGWHGVAYHKPLARLRETIDVCRAVWRREPAVSDGPHPLPINDRRALKIMAHPPRPAIPIYLASLGSRSVELAAEKADGWLTTMFWPERAGDVWGESLARGGSLRDGALEPLQIVASAYVAIDSGQDAHLARLRAHTAHYVGGMGPPGNNFYHDLLCRYGFSREAAEITDRFLSRDKKAAAAAVPTEYLEGVSLIGDRDSVKQRLSAYQAAGVGLINVTLAGETLSERLEQLALLRALVSET